MVVEEDAVAAQNLARKRGRAPGLGRAGLFRQGDLTGRGLVRLHQLGQSPDKQLRLRQVRGHLHQFGLDQLEGGDRFAELPPLAGVLQGDLP